jgi:hypothetical protein
MRSSMRSKRGYLDPDRRGDRADECDAIEMFSRIHWQSPSSVRTGLPAPSAANRNFDQAALSENESEVVGPIRRRKALSETLPVGRLSAVPNFSRTFSTKTPKVRRARPRSELHRVSR